MGKNDYFGVGSPKASPFGSYNKRVDDSNKRHSTNSTVLAVSEEIAQLATSMYDAKMAMADQVALYARQAINGDVPVPNQKTAIAHIQALVDRMQLPPESSTFVLIHALAKIIMNG